MFSAVTISAILCLIPHAAVLSNFCRATFTMFVSSCTAELADRVFETNAASRFWAARIDSTNTVATLTQRLVNFLNKRVFRQHPFGTQNMQLVIV